MDITLIKENELNQISDNNKNIIFGAGDFGTKVLLPILKNNGVNIHYFWDNDPNKQGKFIDNIKILSYDEISKFEHLNIIVGSNYIMQEKERIKKLSYDNIYQYCMPEDLVKVSQNIIDKSIIEIEKIKYIFKDELSLKSIDAMLDYLKNRNVDVFKAIANPSEHYLVPEVVKALKNNDTYIDLGAFIGEFPLALKKMNINFDKCYCFEISAKNCEKLKNNIKKIGLSEKVECCELAAFDSNGFIKINDDGANSKISDNSADNIVETVKLDDYMKNKKFNYIKSDIEGAEMNALIGAKEVLIKNRPIIAFSIYHSLEDYYTIPQFLYNLLKNYTFYIRNHSVYCAEIVVYAIPNERNA